MLPRSWPYRNCWAVYLPGTLLNGREKGKEKEENPCPGRPWLPSGSCMDLHLQRTWPKPARDFQVLTVLWSLSKFLRIWQKKTQNLSGWWHVHLRLQETATDNFSRAMTWQEANDTYRKWEFGAKQELFKPQRTDTDPHRLHRLELRDTEIKTTVLQMFKEIDNKFQNTCKE